MANKRQNAESKALIPPKKVKTATTEFNGTVFKSVLKDPSRAFKGLGTFVQMAKQLPCADMYDVVEGYIKISAECAEIFSLLDGDSHSETELVLIFQSLELILLRTASDLSHFGVVGSTIVKKTVCTHMKLLQSTLSSGNYQLVRRCLCLMTAMVLQGTDAAHEILCSLVFSRTLSNLARLRDKTGRPDVRMAYVQFALSFLMYGDGSSIGQILESRDFLSEILNSGLKEDRLSTVCLILSTLQTKIVQNMAVSKTQKLRFFSASTLIQIASLYRWNGIVDATTDYTERMNEQEAGGHHVREMVHSFLLELCCSRKYGISFHNPSLGTAGRAGNIVLLQFAVSLKQAVDDEKVAELLVSILKANPDILQRYFKETHLSFSPRMKDIWLQSVGLLRKIYEAQSDVSPVFQSRQTGSASCLLSMVLVTSLPPVCNKTFFTQGLNLPGVVGQHATLSVLAFILRRAQRNMEQAVSRPVLDRFEAHGFNPMREFIQLYKEALSKILPDITSIVSKWQSLSKKETAQPKGTEEGKSERDPKLIPFKALLLQVICLYQKVVPHLVAESRFDFSKLLKGIVSERGLREDVPPVLQYQILHLALELPASKFSWFCLQDRAGPDQERGEGSVLYVLLKVFVSCSSSRLQSMTRMLILKVLRESGVFEHTWRELELWLDHLLGLDSSQQETVLHFLEQVLMKAVCNPYVYIDKVAVILQEAVCLQAEGRRQGRNTGTVPLSDTDDASGSVLIKECGGTDFKDGGTSVSRDALPLIFPFSAAVPAVMEARNRMLINARDPEGVVCEYTCAVLCDVLHSQTDPLALCLMLQRYDTELLSSQIPPLPQSALAQFRLYYSKWLSKQPQVLQFGPVQTAVASPSLGLPAFLKSCYMEGPDTFLQDSFWSGLEESLSTLELSQYPGVMSQTLIYLRSYVERFSSLPKSQALEVLGSMLKVLHTLFLKLHSAAETPPAPPEAPQDEERDLEMSFSSVQEVNKQQVLLAVSRAAFKHPVLVQWFLAVELGAVPAPSLSPQRVRQLCARLTDGVLTLLRCCAETLRDLQALELISPYLSSTRRALLRELRHSTSLPVADSRSVKSFLTLHGYMDPSCVNEVASALLVLPRGRLLADGDGLSVYGRAALTVLTESVGHAAPGKDAPRLSQLHLHNLGALYTSCHSQQLAQLLLQVLSRESSYAKLVPVDVLLHCLRCPCSPELSAALVQNCSTHCLSFELWCLDQSDLTDLTAQNSGFHPVLISYLQLTAAEDPCRLRDVQKAVLQKITKTLLPELLSSVLQLEDGSSLEQSVSLLSRFIQLGLGAPDLTRLIRDLPGILQKPDTFTRWPLADSITQRLVGTPEEQRWRKSLVAASLRWLSSTYREQKTACVREEEEMLQRIRTLTLSGEDVTDLDWNTFVKLGLKYRYRGGRFMETLSSLLEIVYKSENTQGFLPLKTLHMMLTSHSLFLPTMLAPPDEAECGPESKEALVSLLFMLVRKCPEVCITNHFHVLLGAYGATLNPTDQKLLLLLKEYERNNISLVEFQCLLWGRAAVEYHKAQRSLGSTLWTQLSSEKLLEQLDSDRMLNTVTFFPLRLRLVSQENEELISVNTQFCPDRVFLYDPSFLIPLFSYIVRPESVLDCRKFVSSHALGVTLVALSSYDPNMRAAAYHVLGSLYQHLEGAYFKEKKQLLYLLDIIRNGIQKQNLRVSFLHSTYMTKVAQLILKPEEHMYLVVNRFILATPYVDLKRVPDFFRLFYSFDTEHKLEREWLLKVLEDGVRDELSYDLCEQQGIYHVLLGFCSSPLSDPSVQNQIVSLLRRTAYIKKAASDLIKAHGILKWIVQLTEKRFIERRMLSSVIGLLHTLWFTNLDTNDSWTHRRNPGQELQSDSPIKSLPYSFTTDFLCALLSVIKHLRTEVEVADLQRFLQNLESVLQHHGMAAGTRDNTDWLMMQPQTLSCSAALGLLHCWGTLDCDTELLCDLRDLASRHHVKAVPGIEKESMEGKSKCNTENNEKSLLECRQLLVNIFTHWEPCSSHPNLNLTEVPLDEPALSDSNVLINETAHILIKWTLRTLSETPYDETSVFSTLKWLQIVLVPHAAVVKSLLGDEAVRVNLLRLYLQTCESGKQKQSGFRLDMVQRFTEMMLHLLNADKSPSVGVLPASVIGACLHPPADEAGTREAGLKLLSLYIHDLWNRPHHDAVPQLLLTHARLLTRHGKKSSKKSRPPIMYICEEILSSVDCAVSL